MRGHDPLIRDPYHVLGVDPSASTADIRRAYVRLARVNHPDAAGGDVARMAEINAAWQLLGDPQRRASFDGPAVVTSAPRANTAPVDVATPTAPLPPARIPWRLMGVMASLGIGIVIAGAIANDDPPPEEVPDQLLFEGSCVQLDARLEASEVPCRGEGDLVVVSIVGFDGTCPAPSIGYRDRQGLGLACTVVSGS
jgi:hypothetical protein